MDYLSEPMVTSTLNSYSHAAQAGVGVAIWGVIAFILAIVGGVLVYFLFVKKDAQPKGKFANWLKNFLDFKEMWIEVILKVLYYIGTIFMILISFAFIGVSFLTFLCCLVLGPVVLRLVYEGFMMGIMNWRNITDIAENTKKK